MCFIKKNTMHGYKGFMIIEQIWSRAALFLPTMAAVTSADRVALLKVLWWQEPIDGNILLNFLYWFIFYNKHAGKMVMMLVGLL